VFTFKLFDMVI